MPGDYAHARHAGNAGDVLKHVALLALLEELKPASYLETHAGDGLYPLGSAGEWGDGIQRLWNYDRPGLVARYAQLVRSFSSAGAQRPGKVPGSPSIAARFAQQLILHEVDPSALEVLRRSLPQAQIIASDGFAAESAANLVLIDPPYTSKDEWAQAARTAARLKGTPLALWYPIKALTRPRALIAELARSGVHGTAVELHWTPLRLKRDRLNGAGMILVDVPRSALANFVASLVELGPLLMTHGEWGAVQLGF